MSKKRNILTLVIALLLVISPFSAMEVGASYATDMDSTKHDFRYSSGIAPGNICSGCHNFMSPFPYWLQDTTEEKAYFTQTSNPNYVRGTTLYCYDCHDNHDAVDNNPDYNLFINEPLGRYIPQDVAFDGDMRGNEFSYDSSPSDGEAGYYETSTSGHYIKSSPAGLTGIQTDDKLPCTDCHNPHNKKPSNEVFINVGTGLLASTNTRSGTGTGREICAYCHAYGDDAPGSSLRSVDVNAGYGSTDNIIQTIPGVSAHESTDTTTPCTDCHTHNGALSGISGVSHDTHLSSNAKGPNPALSCGDCHVDGIPTFEGGKDLSETEVCDSCHSPGGAYNGVDSIGDSVGAKDNWADGIYDGDNVLPGKEKWCAGCHDDVPANSQGDGSGIDAPNVAGDDSTYGYYVNGHGIVDCSGCHDNSLTHIDGDSRTYSFDSAYYGSSQSGDAYASGYRLRDIGGEVPLMIPANYGITFDYNAQTMADNAFRLCFDCHDSSKIFDNTPGDGIDSNFKASLPNPPREYSYAWGRRL